MQFLGLSGEELNLVDVSMDNRVELLHANEGELRIYWNRQGISEVEVDGIAFSLPENSLIFLTEYHHLDIRSLGSGAVFRFNRGFYCLQNHDDEVGCKGMLFYGAMHLASIELEASDLDIFELLIKVFAIEMQSRDNLQLDMLRMLMKRWIILCTRVFKRQRQITAQDDHKLQLVKEFNILVEVHFRTLHDVKSYADLLHKSPKTLSHFFGKYHQKTPLQVIQDRVLLEARRLLTYTDKPIKEIAYAIGFEDIQAFSRFFSKKVGISAKNYRSLHTQVANHSLESAPE